MTFLQTIATRKPLKRKDLSPGKGGPPGHHLDYSAPKEPDALDGLHPLRSTGTCTTGPTRFSGTAGHVTAPHSHEAIFALFCLKFGPLVRCENVADSQKHLGIRLFEFRACLCRVVDLRQDFIRVR